MDKAKVLKAVGLYYMTDGLASMHPTDPKFQDLLDMEREMFDLVITMTPDETKAYQKLIDYWSVLVDPN